MSRDLPNALEELVRTPAQIKSLRSTYEQIKNRIGSDRDGSSDPEARVTMEKLIEVVKIIRSRW